MIKFFIYHVTCMFMFTFISQILFKYNKRERISENGAPKVRKIINEDTDGVSLQSTQLIMALALSNVSQYVAKDSFISQLEPLDSHVSECCYKESFVLQLKR